MKTVNQGALVYGALAPPVGLDSPLPPAASSGFVVFSEAAFSSLPVPPYLVLSPPDPPVSAGGVSLLVLSVSADSPVEVFVFAVVVEVDWAAAFSAEVSVGGTSSGVALGTASETLLEPQAPRATPEISAAATARAMRARTRATAQLGPEEFPGGLIRRPQVGQSLRSFCAICSHHGQKRRFSTDQGSLDCEGASGRTLPRTSIGSSVSRSR